MKSSENTSFEILKILKHFFIIILYKNYSHFYLEIHFRQIKSNYTILFILTLSPYSNLYKA